MDESIKKTNSQNNIKTKLRPNDKVSVRYSDGHMEFDVKYKKVVDDIKAGKCQII
jgi:hypothetical protein